MKRTVVLFLLLVLAFQLCSCGALSEGRSSDKELYNAGLDLIDTMDEMVRNEAYVEIMGGGVLVYDMVEEFKDYEYSSPTAVYRISPPQVTDLLRFAGMGDTGEAWNMLSDNLKEQLEYRVSFNTVISALNSKKGSSVMAFAALYTAMDKDERVRVNEPTVFLYVFEKGIPVAVTFEEGGRMQGQFAFLDDVNNLSSLFAQLNCSVTQINLK